MPPQRRAPNPTNSQSARADRATRTTKSRTRQNETRPQATASDARISDLTNESSRATTARNRKHSIASNSLVASNSPVASKPSVAIVGAGRLGTALAIALEQRGYRITTLVSRTRSHAQRAARLLHARPHALAAAALDQIPDSRILIIATPDDQIAATATRLAATLDARQPMRDAHKATRDARNVMRAARTATRVVLHVSGALSSDALAPLRARGFAIGSLHPLVSVSDPATNAKDFDGAFFCVEGDTTAVRAARRIVRDLGGHSFNVATRDKSLYHAAAVTASGHLLALFDLATELLALCGVSPTHARRALLPLARGTLNNLSHARSHSDALTGPFARADAATIDRHIAHLAAPAVPRDALDLYALLGLRSLQLASKRGVSADDLVEIRRRLEEVVRRRRTTRR
jgi:predicted short-subunit dehydrogenase-like oxidoreductase (DUF2520 family)